MTLLRQFHTGDSYGYRFSRGEKAVVYSTDCEHKFTVLDESYPFVHFYRDADVLVFDAMYSLADMVSIREDWGHSSNVIAVELAQSRAATGNRPGSRDRRAERATPREQSCDRRKSG